MHKLDQPVRNQLLDKLEERLENPRVPAAAVSGGPDLYKIKLRSVGLRLVYKVIDARVVVYVLAVGRRDDNAAYDDALKRNDD